MKVVGGQPAPVERDRGAPEPVAAEREVRLTQASSHARVEVDTHQAPRPMAPDATLTPAVGVAGPRLRLPEMQADGPALVVEAQGPLMFSAPFGDGPDRHVGVRAASALVPLGSAFVIAQDDSNFAALWTPSGLTPLRLFPDVHGDTYSSARGNKAHKPDLEAGASFDVGGRPAAVLFGSGSTDARLRAAWVSEGPEGHQVRTAELPSLYAAARQRLGLAADVLNLEAAAAVGERVYFFQRGNGEGGVNASFVVPRATLEAALVSGAPIAAHDLREVRRHSLGALDGCPLGFSDAAPLPDGRVLFLAAAEASPNTYDDGAVAGSVIGVLEHDGTARVLQRVPDGPDGPYKLEGLAVERVDGARVHLRALEDADDPTQASTALRLRLELPPAR